MPQITHFMYGTSSTYRADAFTSASATNVKEGQITAAIAAAVADGVQAVFVPQSMLPYNASLVTFNNSVKMLREGSDPAIHDPMAYGAAGNAVITVRATGAGTKATITGQDDTVALQACINASAANLEVVQLPPNAFKITLKLQLPTNTQIVGSGWNSQICPDWFDSVGGQSGGPGYLVNADQTNGNSNIVLRNFYINGAGPGTASASGLPNGIAAAVFFRGNSGGACTDIVVRELKITNTPGISIAYQGCQRVQIINNLIHDCGKDGITGAWFHANARLQDVLVQGNTIWNVGDDGVAVLSSQDSTSPNSDQRPTRIAIIGNTIRDVTSNGAGRGIIAVGCDNVTISGNVIHNSYGCGIAVWYDTFGSLFSNRRITVTGNVVQDSGQAQAAAGLQPQHGISVRGAQQLAITGNTVDHSYQTGIEISDSSVAGGANSDINVTGNVVSNNGTAAATDMGIYLKAGVANGALRMVVASNNVVANIGAGIQSQDADMVLIQGNQCINNGQGVGDTAQDYGIIAGANLFNGLIVTIRDNFCTDTQGTKTQLSGIVLANMGHALGVVTVQDNYGKGNKNTSVNVMSSEFLVNLAPTTLIYRRDDPSPFTLTDAATIAVDCRASDALVVTLNVAGATRAMGTPTNVTSGKRLHFTIIQDGTGGRALTWPAVFKVTWADTGNTLGKRSTIAFIYDGTNWNQDGAQTPYV